MSQYNRATKSIAAARLDWWEAGHFCGSSKRRTRSTSKRHAARASRRLSREIVRNAA